MKKLNTDIKRGEVILFTSGAYSDYGHAGEVIFIKDCDLRAVGETFKETEKTEWDSLDLSTFATWLTAQGYCLPLDCREVHIGSYSELKFD